MLFDQNTKLLGCDLDSDVLKAAEPDRLLTIVPKVLNPGSDATKATGGESGSSKVQGTGGGGFGSQNTDTSDAGAYFSHSLGAVRGLWAVQSVPLHSARHMNVNAEEPAVLDKPESAAR